MRLSQAKYENDFKTLKYVCNKIWRVVWKKKKVVVILQTVISKLKMFGKLNILFYILYKSIWFDRCPRNVQYYIGIIFGNSKKYRKQIFCLPVSNVSIKSYLRIKTNKARQQVIIISRSTSSDFESKNKRYYLF